MTTTNEPTGEAITYAAVYEVSADLWKERRRSALLRGKLARALSILQRATQRETLPMFDQIHTKILLDQAYADGDQIDE